MSINETNYPHRPFRLNHVDIRTIQIFDPLVMKTTTGNDISNSWEQLHGAGATLENGVRIKNIDAAILNVAVGGTTADGGFELAEREEVFVEVRQLSDVYVKSASSGDVTFIAS